MPYRILLHVLHALQMISGQAPIPDAVPAFITMATSTLPQLSVSFWTAGVYRFVVTVTVSGLTAAANVTVWVPIVELVPTVTSTSNTSVCYIGLACTMGYTWLWLPVTNGLTSSVSGAADLLPLRGGGTVGLLSNGSSVEDWYLLVQV